MDAEVENSNGNTESVNEISGSVGDGPIVGAAMRVLGNDGTVIAEFESDYAANYNLSLKTKGKYYPLRVEARDGTDMVTFLNPDFAMFSAVLDPGKRTVANINPFTTVALELASNMPGGQSTNNIKVALEIVTMQLNSGLDTLMSGDPMSTEIDTSNISEIVKSSETLGETIRRSRNALHAAGYMATGDDIVQALGSDLTDSVIDGLGGTGADARISAVTVIVRAQTALESMRNSLYVNGVEATGRMTAAIGEVIGVEPDTTLNELAATQYQIEQAKIGVAAAEQVSLSADLTVLKQALSSIWPGMLPGAVNNILPRDASGMIDNALIAVASGDSAILKVVNDTSRNGGYVPVANQPPTIQGSAPSKATVGSDYEFLPSATDPDGDALTFAITGRPAWVNFEMTTGRLYGTPSAADIGEYRNIVIDVTDGEFTAAMPEFSITVEAVATNSPPTISGSAPSGATVGDNYDFTPAASDPDGDPITFSISNPPAWASFSTMSGRLFGTPGPGSEGTYGNIVVTVTDSIASASLAPFSITVSSIAVNQPPSISGTPVPTVVVGTSYVFEPAASDPDSDPLTFSITGLPPWASFDSTNGRISGTPNAEDVGIHSGIVITVSDGRDSAQLGPFEIAVEALGTGSVTLNWTPPTENEDGSPLVNLAGYKIFWGQNPGEYRYSITVDNPGITTYVIENLAPGTYEFACIAFNTSGVESELSNAATMTVP